MADEQIDQTTEPAAGAATPEELPPPNEEDGTYLGPGSALTIDEANEVIGGSSASIVLPLGSQDAGKTTLVVELYEMFLRGPVCDISFTYSETLPEFELIAFAARLESDADIPDTWRTRLNNERPALHMRLNEGGEDRDLVFVNLSGELTDRIRDGQDPQEEIPILESADRVLICVDGLEVARDAGSYSRALSKTRQFIRMLIEKGRLAPAARLGLVLTKLDEVHADPEAVKRWSEGEPELQGLLVELGRPLDTFQTAARPMASDPPSDGMAPLLKWLIAENEVEPAHGQATVPPARAMSRSEEDDD